MRSMHPRDRNKYIRRQIVFATDLEFKRRLKWRSEKFKEPFLGFEEDVKLREFRKYVEAENDLKFKEPIKFQELDFQRIEFEYRMFLKNKLYDISVRSTFMGDVADLDMPFLLKDAWQAYLRKKFLIHMYARAVKKKLDVFITPEYITKKRKEVEKVAKDIVKGKRNKKEVLEKIKAEKEGSLWSLNRRIMIEYNEVSQYPAESILNYLLNDLLKDFHHHKDDGKQDQKMFCSTGPWTEATIPFFFLNFSTGTVDYDFWNNSDERVEKRKKSIQLILKGKKTWNDLKKEELSIALSQLRGMFGTYDFVLSHQKIFGSSLVNNNQINNHLPYYSKIYNWFQKPSLAANYPNLVYGLIGPVIIPHWCLIFTITKTRKNIYFTVSDMSGKVVLTVSAGSFHIHKRKRLSPFALEPLYQKVLLCLKKLKVKNVIIIMKFKAKYLYLHTANFFRNNHISVKMILDRLPIPHNGIRARKPKRL